ncbi:MAG: peptide chain release factor 1 [Patescibacteria group bacterium]|nr:peptide chain release factor 1 [Patescibacteria group bacterium]
MPEIKTIKEEYDEILQRLTDPELISDWEKFETLTKRKNYLEKIIGKEKEIKNLEKQIEENRAILKSQEDQELVSLAEIEITQLVEKKKTLEEELKKLLSEEEKNVPSSASPSSAIVEIRAGAGGEEAALFAADLFRMYSKYSDSKNWKKTVLDCHYSELGGIKQIIFELKDGDVLSEMQKEAGVHRVQRIPITEKSGRIHTSTVSVAVLPKPQKGKIVINPNDLKVDTYKASGPGGQYVNKRMTAVRITHLPSGLVVTSQTERNLQQNRENALSILEAKLLEKKEMEESIKMGRERRAQIGKAQRAEKIRTYNFPQNRITDHRIKKSFHNLKEIMEGKLEPIISALQKSNV